MVIEIIKNAFYHVMLVAGPLLMVSLIVGLGISIFQAATSISEQTLTFVPKLIITFIVTVMVMPFMISNLKTFTLEMFKIISTMK